jgi:DNA-binding NarL/FixJ family response regulator
VGSVQQDRRKGTVGRMTNSLDRIRILIVDDHPLLREGIVSLVEKQADMLIVAEASNGKEAVQLFRQHIPDITLMDLRLPGMDGIDAMTSIVAQFPDAKVIVLTTFSGDTQILRALKAGARGYLLKELMRKELLDAIRTVQAGRKRIPPEIAAQIAEHASDTTLTRREIEVLQLVACGNPNKLVADKLSVTEDTIKMHVKSILSKLGASDRTHAVTIAVKRGIMEL